MAEKRSYGEQYREKLKDPRWQKKRLEIFERDNFTCRYCCAEEITLSVHHLFYVKGIDPWEYSNEALITLCDICHRCETEDPSVGQLLSALHDCKFTSGTIRALAEMFDGGPRFHAFAHFAIETFGVDAVCEGMRLPPELIEYLRGRTLTEE